VSGHSDQEIDAALRALATAGIRVGWRRITAYDLADLRPVEARHVRHAVERRRQEFATGRALLRELIGNEADIPVAANRSPVLPRGFRGSLAHDEVFAIAAVSDDPTVLAIGIDLEPATPLETDLAALILRADEDPLDAHLAFTLKEAAYKAWSTLGGRLLDHADLRLSVAADMFVAEVVPDGAMLSGRWAAAAGRWTALVVVRDHLEGADLPSG
jgi:4'-phosphopantetheinyl transferase EntD